MTDKELIRKIAHKLGRSEDEISLVVNAWIEGMVTSLKQYEGVIIRNFGTCLERRRKSAYAD